ncbi:unnamed protein product [Ceratitis capitata]|uniref:(Mediterranean fruit fly) hypothetical protein n=1 Tax=Ceratitis capitata TaxID=7213 RepID=A0A811U273_CERCA|nr:unnamed protein product [Ceratitis capitata]
MYCDCDVNVNAVTSAAFDVTVNASVDVGAHHKCHTATREGSDYKLPNGQLEFNSCLVQQNSPPQRSSKLSDGAVATGLPTTQSDRNSCAQMLERSAITIHDQQPLILVGVTHST